MAASVVSASPRNQQRRQRHLLPLAVVVFVVIILAGLPAASAFAPKVSSSSPSSSRIMSASSSVSHQSSSCSTRTTTLGPVSLRNLVKQASIDHQKHSLDANGIVWLEHLNLVVGDMATATKFYIDFLGFTSERDPNPKSNHFNLGQQQFHLAATKEGADDGPQRVTGSIGLTVPSLERIRARVANAKAELAGTLFSVVKDDQESIMTVTCPWGNIIHLYDISMDDNYESTDTIASQSSQKMVKLHGEGGTYGPHRMAVRGNPGIRYVEIACRAGLINSIADFYEIMLGCDVSRIKATDEANAAIVSVGPGVHLAFVENKQLSDSTIKQMEGVHACIYIPHFQQTYNKLKESDLIWTNPRFTHLDSCDTWEEACKSRTFRFKDVIDVTTGEKILELEHETRPMLHGQYMKVPPYVPN